VSLFYGGVSVLSTTLLGAAVTGRITGSVASVAATALQRRDQIVPIDASVLLTTNHKMDLINVDSNAGGGVTLTPSAGGSQYGNITSNAGQMTFYISETAVNNEDWGIEYLGLVAGNYTYVAAAAANVPGIDQVLVAGGNAVKSGWNMFSIRKIGGALMVGHSPLIQIGPA
jgi:hypothetical protein